MTHHQILLACRDNREAEIIRAALHSHSAPVFHKSGQLFEQYLACPESIIVMTSLIIDETAFGLLTKAAITHPGYFILYARHANKALNILRLFGCGAAAILGPNELPLITEYISPSSDYLKEIVMPPFFIDDDESSLKDPPARVARPLHISFIGSQAMMSCANALLNINASKSISMACVAPENAWAQEHLATSIKEYTLWQSLHRASTTGGAISLCSDFESLSKLTPPNQHFVIIHGHLSEEESNYISTLSSETRIFTTSNEGYTETIRGTHGAVIRPERLWDIFISSLYGN